MTTLTLRPAKLADLDNVIPGLANVWKQIKTQCGTKKRVPTIILADYAEAMCPNDDSLCRRFALDITTMKLSAGLRVSAGEWAVHASKNHDEGVEGIGNGQALLDCEWNDFHGFFTLRIQVAPGALPKQVTQG